jgi:putative toxin-antitoxin system antitoxin component (TIGR02293 family)
MIQYNVSTENGMATTTLKRGQVTASVHQQIGRIQAGLSFRAVQNLQKALDIPLQTVASVLGMSRATLHRRKLRGKIDGEESEKLVRYQRLLKQAENVFGDGKSAREWLTHKQPGLGNAAPLEFARTEIGAREVENLLGRIEYGVHS